jgi:hypothetical protein
MEVMFMKACEIPRADLLPTTILLNIGDPDLDFSRARATAFARAKTYSSDPTLLSWFDRKKGAYSPQGECCREGEPSWVTYARARGGNLTIDINREDYVFIFRGQEGLS